MNISGNQQNILDELEYALPFAGIPTFMKLPYSRDVKDADLVIMGIPFDAGATNRPGTRYGPKTIREQSAYAAAFQPVYPWTYDLTKQFKLIDFGDVTPFPGSGTLEMMLELSEATAKDIFRAGASLLTLGGDHTLPIGLIRAAAKHFGSLAMIHLDAHQDSYEAESYAGFKLYNHGVFATELVKEGHIDPKASSQIYIRTVQPASPKGGYDIVYADEALELSPEALAERVKSRVGDKPVYLSLDIDALDPAFAPGTGSPVPGGPSSLEVRRFLKALDGINLVAADLVEVNPLYDPAQVTAVTAAALALDLLYLMGNSRSKRRG